MRVEKVTWHVSATAAAAADDDDDDECVVLQEVAAQVLTLSLLGYTHSTFLVLAAECSEELLPACSPKALADLAVGFSNYRLDPKGLHERLVQAAAAVLPRFSEYDLARLLTGLMYRKGLDLTPIIDALEVCHIVMLGMCYTVSLCFDFLCWPQQGMSYPSLLSGEISIVAAAPPNDGQ